MSNQHAAESAGQGEQQTLAQCAQHRVARRRAQRSPEGQVAAAFQPAGAQQVRHVRARHQQHRDDGGQQEPERAARSTDDLIRQRSHSCARVDRCDLIGTVQNAVQLDGCLGRGHVRRQAQEHQIIELAR